MLSYNVRFDKKGTCDYRMVNVWPRKQFLPTEICGEMAIQDRVEGGMPEGGMPEGGMPEGVTKTTLSVL